MSKHLFSIQDDQRGLFILAPHPPSGGKLKDVTLFLLHQQKEGRFRCEGLCAGQHREYDVTLPPTVLSVTSMGMILLDEIEVYSA